MRSVRRFSAFVALTVLVLSGCGATQQRDATEQLLTSDAVDSSVAQIDFRALSGKTVYFDTTYLKNLKGNGFVNADYVTSSLRQQLVAARCRLQDKKEDAEYIVEARIGTLGTDRHEVTYGMPANSFLTAASSLVPNSPPLPTLPELSLAKRNEQLAAAKIAAFAYHRETGEPVWQSGVAPTRSTAKDIWVLGAGPIQRGQIYGRTQFAGTPLGFPLYGDGEATERAPLVDYGKPAVFHPQLEKPEKLAEKDPEAEPKPDKPKPEEKKAERKEAKPASPPKKENPASKATPNPRNPIKSATKLESGLKLRFQFDEVPQAAPQLFRLDPEPSPDRFHGTGLMEIFSIRARTHDG